MEGWPEEMTENIWGDIEAGHLEQVNPPNALASLMSLGQDVLFTMLA